MPSAWSCTGLYKCEECEKHSGTSPFLNLCRDYRILSELQVLYKYIVHRAFGFPFTSTAQLIERDSVFVPAGWDGEKKIEIVKVCRSFKLHLLRLRQKVLRFPKSYQDFISCKRSASSSLESFLKWILAGLLLLYFFS